MEIAFRIGVAILLGVIVIMLLRIEAAILAYGEPEYKIPYLDNKVLANSIGLGNHFETKKGFTTAPRSEQSAAGSEQSITGWRNPEQRRAEYERSYQEKLKKEAEEARRASS